MSSPEDDSSPTESDSQKPTPIFTYFGSRGVAFGIESFRAEGTVLALYFISAVVNSFIMRYIYRKTNQR